MLQNLAIVVSQSGQGQVSERILSEGNPHVAWWQNSYRVYQSYFMSSSKKGIKLWIFFRF